MRLVKKAISGDLSIAEPGDPLAYRKAWREHRQHTPLNIPSCVVICETVKLDARRIEPCQKRSQTDDYERPSHIPPAAINPDNTPTNPLARLQSITGNL
ncbi:hypothetical protein [Sulfitobacter sp. DSM 110093]|uniref:hypothetical protein n=1 Tax=Sulfitobacter sp. DSM 110093 TaxID=2883127 RepID=UPI001FACEE52|nr:hypothetical protein [Sulfitobacter sp. DSM 110093]